MVAYGLYTVRRYPLRMEYAEWDNGSAPRSVERMTASLSLVGVEKGYSCGGVWTPVLAGVSFEVLPGEIVAVIGGRLEGKTTVLDIAAGLKRPDSGRVLFGDLDLAACSDRRRSELRGREIVWINRDGPGLQIEMSKFVGLPLALHGAGRRQAERAASLALERVGARECVGRYWGELSNWQRVLVSLARAFAGSPLLIVIDDLLDALGSSATEQASDLLRSLLEESKPRCGVLMSASDIDSAIFADHLWSITRKHTLKLIAGQPTTGAGNVLSFPERNSVDRRGSRGIGSW
jgi:putative ABC transport system ATP-binding protein